MMDSESRYTLLECLRNLAELKNQVAPIELVCEWFEDIYAPESKKFSSQFSREELLVLRNFHESFDSVVNDIPLDKDWREKNEWKFVQNAAIDALGLIPR